MKTETWRLGGTCLLSSALARLCSVSALFLTFSMEACSTDLRERTVVYDENYASAAAVKNLWCAPERRASCAREAVEAEASYLRRMQSVFQATPECSTVHFVVLSGNGADARAWAKKLEGTWRNDSLWLRVNFSPRLQNQPFDLGQGTGRGLIGGYDVGANAAYICEAVKHNGVTWYW